MATLRRLMYAYRVDCTALLVVAIWGISAPFRKAALGFFAKGELTASQFGHEVTRLLAVYPREHVYAQFNPLGSHDTERILTLCGGDVARMKLALLFQFTYVGAPSIYYGDEIGLKGGEDPDCRRAFPWSQDAWDLRLRGHVQKLTQPVQTLAAREDLATLLS